MDFDTRDLNDSDGYEGLDGTLINIDTSAEILTPNKNIYFAGFVLLALGFALAGYGIYRYFNVSDTKFIQSEHNTAYTLIGFGCPFIISGLILVLKAAIYLIILKPLLKKAKFTKCNIFCVINDQSFTDSDGRLISRKQHTLRVYYFDDNGNYHKKIIKGLLAFDLFRKLRTRYMLSDNLVYYSFKNYCLAAYNDRGKLILVYKWQELK